MQIRPKSGIVINMVIWREVSIKLQSGFE